VGARMHASLILATALENLGRGTLHIPACHSCCARLCKGRAGKAVQG
jgi:hypothetical protein